MPKAVLYGLSRSVYTRIVRLALAEKQVEYRLEEVEIFRPEGIPASHVERHPFGRIPAFEHDGFSLYETAAITRYIDEVFPGPALQPSRARDRARMNQAIAVLDAYGYRPMIWGVFVQRVAIPREGGSPDEAAVASALPGAGACLAALTRILDGNRYFAGEMLSLADLHAAPMLLYFSRTPEGRRMLGEHVALEGLLAELEQRPSVVQTRSVYD